MPSHTDDGAVQLNEHQRQERGKKDRQRRSCLRLHKERDEHAAQGNASHIGRELVDDQIPSAERPGKEKIDLIRRKMKRRTCRQQYG
jgi:hypothetical protein